MFKPYRQVEETEEFIVYEFKTIYLYAMYCIVGLLIGGSLTQNDALSLAGIILMVLYFLLVSTQYLGLHGKMKRARKESSVEISGSKWSFSNPLRIKIKREFT